METQTAVRYQVSRVLPNGEVIDTEERAVDPALLTPSNLSGSKVDWSADGLPYQVRTWDCLNKWTRVYTRIEEEFASVVIPPDAFGALTEDRPRDWSHSDIAAWAAEYERNNPAQQHAPSFGWANPEGN